MTLGSISAVNRIRFRTYVLNCKKHHFSIKLPLFAKNQTTEAMVVSLPRLFIINLFFRSKMENLWDKICAEHAEVDIDNFSDQPKRMQREETQIDYKKCSAGSFVFSCSFSLLYQPLTTITY